MEVKLLVKYDSQSLAIDIERLLMFALKSSLIEPMDVIPARNALIDLFQLEAPATNEIQDDEVHLLGDSPAPILERMLDYAAETGLIPANNTTQRDLMDARIMGLLMPRQSEVVRKFWETAHTQSMEEATSQFYHMSKCSNYIRTDRIAKNEYWTTETDYGQMEITINLSKPEKDPEEIAALKNAPALYYPKCLLCLENVGYAGRIDHPARQNHRVIPIQLEQEEWYLQYSPYVYYHEHSIVFSKEHRPMKISETTFRRLLQFVEQFPHYFIGSNADLPIVGGSILNHDHFQGGRHTFPMEKACPEAEYVHSSYTDVNVFRVKWPMSVIRLSSKNKESLIKLSTYVLEIWKKYFDTEADILAYTVQDGQRVPHNTITPIARKNQQGEFEMDLVLRNNRTSLEHPDGIFHPHQPLHHIKKENIGLIEVMGLAVLPGRLIDELKQIVSILSGKSASILNQLENNKKDPLNKHLHWIYEMIDHYGDRLSTEEAWQRIREEVGRKFTNVLMDAGIFKRNELGQNSFHQFMTHAGFRLK